MSAADTLTAYLPHAALCISVLALFISWRSYRLAHRSKLLERPYLHIDRKRHETFYSLSGPNAEHWQLDSARLVWPLGQRFGNSCIEKDDGGSIIRSWLEPAGRRLLGGGNSLILFGPGRALVRISASSLGRPKLKQAWWIRIENKAPENAARR